MRAYFSGDRYKLSVDDTVYHLTALAQALVIEEPTLLLEYVAWAKIVLVSRGLRDEHLAGSLVAIRETLAATLDDGLAAAAAEYIDASLEALAGASGTMLQAMEPDAPHADVARDYLEALLAGDRDAAAEVVDDAIDAGVALPEVYEHVFRAAQHEVGRMWQANRISVAIEHYATGATEAIMLKRCAGESSKTAGARRFLGGCVEGEQHDLAIRMVCDVLQSDGWEVSFLGASTPESALLEAVGRLRPAVVGLSTSSFFHIDQTRRAIKSIHDRYPDVKIVVGGGPFDRIDGLAEKVGADARGGDLLGLAARFDLLFMAAPDSVGL
jgi:MerR family transcriptional regulator, light-induced transcriptional regulator